MSQDLLINLGFIYAMIAFGIFFVALGSMLQQGEYIGHGRYENLEPEKKKARARAVLWSPIWPIWFVYLIVKWLVIGIMYLIKVAITGE